MKKLLTLPKPGGLPIGSTVEPTAASSVLNNLSEFAGLAVDDLYVMGEVLAGGVFGEVDVVLFLMVAGYLCLVESQLEEGDGFTLLPGQLRPTSILLNTDTLFLPILQPKLPIPHRKALRRKLRQVSLLCHRIVRGPASAAQHIKIIMSWADQKYYNWASLQLSG